MEKTMPIEKGKIYKINYRDAKGVVTNREIIALSEAPKNITALDITSLSEADKWWLQSMQQEYHEYVACCMANIYNFETWLEHTQQSRQNNAELIKFKRFTVDNIKIIDK
jgi:putative N-acetylmannosamine-6-phosphate epimerase